MSDKFPRTPGPDSHEIYVESKEAKAASELAPAIGSTLVNDLSRNAWLILNHDNDPNDNSDPCHKANWEKIVKSTRAILRAHKIKV